MSQTVAIVQRRMTHYRVPLFVRMTEELAKKGVRLRILHGDPTQAEASKNDSGSMPGAERLATRYLADERLCWQPFMHLVNDCSLVVVTQENKLVNNLWPIINPWRRQRLAFWGHGRNMQASRVNSLREQFKRWTTLRVDWWFAYTELSASFVEAVGYDSDRITVLNNSIDTSELMSLMGKARRTPRQALRASFGLQDAPIGVFVGSLHADKRVDFMLQAARRIRERLPGFQFVVAGSGPERAKVEQAASADGAIRYVGPVHGQRKADLLASADLVFNPGMVGLGILDSFVAGIPMITTDCGLHSPEIAYLQHGVNGWIAPDSLDAFASSVVELLSQTALMEILQQGAGQSASRYSIESMADRFCDGISRALSYPGPTSSA